MRDRDSRPWYRQLWPWLLMLPPAAAVIGGVSLQGGKGSLVGALGGVLLLGAINAALTVAVVSPYWYRIVRGLVIFVAVGLDTLKRQLR